MTQKKKRILIFSLDEDSHVSAVVKHLKNRNCIVDIVDFTKAGSGLTIASKIDDTTDSTVIRDDDRSLRIQDYHGIWARRHANPLKNSGAYSSVDEYNQNEFQSLVKSILSSSGQHKVFPAYTNIFLANDKLTQLKAARSVGLTIPCTVIGNDPVEILDSFDSAKIAVKSYNRPYMRLYAQGQQRLLSFMTRIVTRTEIQSSRQKIRQAPFIAQDYIEKKYELRITVVGLRFFVAGMATQDTARTAVDSRQGDMMDMHYWVEEVPQFVEDALRRYMNLLDMNFACIDMIVTPDDEYVFLEANPNGQWLWIEHKTGMPIAEAIADELVS